MIFLTWHVHPQQNSNSSPHLVTFILNLFDQGVDCLLPKGIFTFLEAHRSHSNSKLKWIWFRSSKVAIPVADFTLGKKTCSVIMCFYVYIYQSLYASSCLGIFIPSKSSKFNHKQRVSTVKCANLWKKNNLYTLEKGPKWKTLLKQILPEN